MKNYSLFALLLLALTACGQFGQLYLPIPEVQAPVAPEPAVKTQPAATTPTNTIRTPEKTK
jgi:predicted small lipoprotein YifL